MGHEIYADVRFTFTICDSTCFLVVLLISAMAQAPILLVLYSIAV